MKIFHEAPIAIFNDVQRVTDGDYALVHLLETNEAYARKFLEAKKAGREIILDNSVFELGKAFDEELFVHWIQKLKPDWYIIPDVLEDSDKTVKRLWKFIEKYPDLPGKRIGVAQGHNVQSFLESYLHASILCDKVAISFDYSWLVNTVNAGPEQYVLGRQRLIDSMVDTGYITANKPVHLLGCYLPQEFKHYRRYPKLIDSIDTSNPCVHGLLGYRYSWKGLSFKESVKLCDLVDSDVSLSQRDDIMWNIGVFAELCKGDCI